MHCLHTRVGLVLLLSVLEQAISEAAGAEDGLTAEERGGRRVRGRCLSPEDLLATRDFVHGLATQVHERCTACCTSMYLLLLLLLLRLLLILTFAHLH